MEYVKIGETEYPATISGRMQDSEWGSRPSKTIKLSMSYADAEAIFRDGLEWSIISEYEDEQGQPVRDEFDNSDYSLAGNIIDYRDGTIAVKMGKSLEVDNEILNILLGEEA